MLVGASGGAATGGALEVACRFAKLFGVHLEALHVRTDIAELALGGGAEGLAAPSVNAPWLETIRANDTARAAKVKADFITAAGHHGLEIVSRAEPGAPGASWREEVGDAPAVVSQRARFFDLTVLGRSDRIVGKAYTDTIEETLMGSGRPVLIAPGHPAAQFGQNIAVFWNGSDQAVRAVVAALPFLRRARTTCVIVIGDVHQKSAEPLREYLLLHGIITTIRGAVGGMVGAPGVHILSMANEEGADLLVMGGYGHTPWREMLLGGTTHDIVKMNMLPVIIAH